MKKKIKLFDPQIDKSEEKSILNVLKSHYWASGSGEGLVKKFETKFKTFVGSKNCVAVNSGTAALNLAVSLFDIKNKEVLLPSMSFVSTANCVTINGGKPVFVDVHPTTLNMDIDDIKKNINKKTAMILPTHFAGLPSNLKEISKISQENNLTTIEDAAHAAGSRYNSKRIGSHSDVVCFSFHPVKNLSMPTGGLISLNHKNHRKMRKILEASRWCGITDRKDQFYDVKSLGNNYYMNEFSAAIGLIQLKKLDKMNKIRKKVAKKYEQRINLENKMPFDENCSYHLYWILVKNREQFIKKMTAKKIEVGIHYRPIHQMTLYKNLAELPITENIGEKIISLPLHPNLTDEEIERVIDAVNENVN